MAITGKGSYRDKSTLVFIYILFDLWGKNLYYISDWVRKESKNYQNSRKINGCNKKTKIDN